MSLDPVRRLANVPESVQPLSALFPEKEGVYVFDFDGVIAAPFDNDIFSLAPWEGEDSFLDDIASRFGIRCEGMDTRYRRHLLHQAAAEALGTEIEPGPAFEHAKLAAHFGRLFVLTARSAWFAGERLRRFLRAHDLQPIDVFNVGRVSKNHQLDLLSREYADKTVSYVDDSPSHVASATKLDADNLEVFLAERTTPKARADLMKDVVIETLRKGAEAFARKR